MINKFENILSEFDDESLRTITLSKEEGTKAIIGKPKEKITTKLASYRFEKIKDYTRLKNGWQLSFIMA